ncbi:hypothetical protein M3Y99_00520700 [Aphelenchoides fujianensis]|nr:hypothetical protein M3Y99_00520700 [Aphelenchoides fujianensis]
MGAIAQLLRIPLHLDLEWALDVDWEEMKRVEEFLYSMNVGHDHRSKQKAAFIKRVARRLQELKCNAYLMKRLRPLNLEKLVVKDERVDCEYLGRHNIHRLDVKWWAAHNVRFSPDRVLSPTIKSLGLLTDYSVYKWNLNCDAIEAYCRRFPALEELHISSNIFNNTEDFVEYSLKLWTTLVDFRERVNVPGLKRIFVTLKLKFSFLSADFDSDWMRKVRAKEPFDRATFWTDPVTQHERMSLVVRYDWPDGPKPTVFHIEADCYPRDKQKTEEPPDSSDDEATLNSPDHFDHFADSSAVLFPE